MKRFVSIILPPIVVLIVVALLTELIVRAAKVPTYVFPAPLAIWASAMLRRDDLFQSLLHTALAASIGFSLSAIVGIFLAILLSSARWIERAFYPYTVFFQTVPIIAIAPLLVIWFGFGTESVAVSAFIASIFPVIASTLDGLLSTDPALVDLFRLYEASRWATLWKLRFPAALPNVFTGLRVAAGLAVIGAIVGEFVAGVLDRRAGLGITVLVAKRPGNTALMFAAIIVASLLGLVMITMINLVAALVLRHRGR